VLHASALDFVWHFVTTGQLAAVVQTVTPSRQSPLVQVPGLAKQQVTNPGFPQVDRAAQRVTAPWQFFGSPFAIA